MHNEGKFNPTSLAEINQALDQVLADESLTGLLISGEEKTFAQGLDLEYLTAEKPDIAMEFVHQCMQMIGRLLRFPMPVVSAINGHAFGLGAMIALASDYQVMREDRGYFCLPEVDLGMVLIPSMNALVINKMNNKAVRDSLLTGSKISGPSAQAAGFIDQCCSLDMIFIEAEKIIAPMLGKNRHAVGGLKEGINQTILAHINPA
jgi:enoyl-CoA hydratase/carnithine racemase